MDGFTVLVFIICTCVPSIVCIPSILVKQGDSISITCRPREAGDVAWYFSKTETDPLIRISADGMLINAYGRYYRYIKRNGVYILNIKAFNEKTVGIFVCADRDGLGKKNGDVHLEMHYEAHTSPMPLTTTDSPVLITTDNSSSIPNTTNYMIAIILLIVIIVGLVVIGTVRECLNKNEYNHASAYDHCCCLV